MKVLSLFDDISCGMVTLQFCRLKKLFSGLETVGQLM